MISISPKPLTISKDGLEFFLYRSALGIIPVAALIWLVLYAFSSQFVEAIYQGGYSFLIGFLVKGQGNHDLPEYLLAFDVFLWRSMSALSMVAVLLCFIACTPRCNADQRLSLRLRLLIFSSLCVVIYARAPSLFAQPRFWAEEATVYFQTAAIAPAWKSILAPHQGYYSLWTNLAGLLATIPPLEYAPIVTTLMALSVLLVVILVILTSESALLKSPLNKGIAGLSVVVVGASGEIWLNSTNAQHYFPLLLFLIFLDDKKGAVRRSVFFVLAVIAGLSSPAANFLAPLFLVRYWQRRDRSDLVLLFLLVLTALTQLCAIIYSSAVLGDAAYYHSRQSRTFVSLKIGRVIRNILYYAFAYPLLGKLGKFSVLPWVGAFLYLVGIWRMRARLPGYWYFPLSICLLTVLSVFASLEMKGGPRYAYSSAVIFSLQLLAYSNDVKLSISTRRAAGFILSVSLLYWIIQFPWDLDNYRDSNWPTWSSEVRTWRQDPSRPLQVWPIWESQTAIGLIWSVQLPPPSPMNR